MPDPQDFPQDFTDTREVSKYNEELYLLEMRLLNRESGVTIRWQSRGSLF